MLSNLIIFSFLFLISLNYLLKEKFTNFLSTSSVASILILLVFLLALFQKKKIKDLFTLTVCSTFISFFLINFVIKIFFFDTQIELIREYKKKNLSLRPAVFPSLFYDGYDIQILSGLSNQQTIYCKEDDFFTVYKSDRYGFNNDDTVYDKENKVILLGDSFTHGACVKEGNDIAGLLRKKNINAINMGMGGNSEISKLATFKEYSIPVKPKYVLWMYTNGDLGGTIKELKNNNINKYFYDENYTQNLIERNSEKDNFINNYLSPLEKRENNDYLIGLFTFYDLRKFLKNLILPKTKFLSNYLNSTNSKTIEIQKFDENERYKKYYTNQNLKLFSSILKKVKNTCIVNKCEVVFVFMPSNKEILKQKKNFLYKNLIFDEVEKLNIKIIDTEPKFLEVNILDYMISHYNDKGYEIVANEIAKKINF